MKGSEIFKDELNAIQNSLLRASIIQFMDEVVPEYFYEVAASSTGKYHPWYSLGYGGLVRHTKAAVKIARDLLNLEQYTDLPRDEIIAALILHDSFKHGEFDSAYTQHNHPEIAVIKLREFANEHSILSNTLEHVAELIYSHMGEWNMNRYSACILPKPITDAQKFVHLCDYLASRRYITVEVN